MINFTQTLALATLAYVTEAAIVADGPWTGNDWYNATEKVGVANGVPYSNDTAMNRRLNSPLSKDGSIDDYLQQANVQRVQSFFTQADWDAGFPRANSVYTYTNFLKAVAKFPAFCNENNRSTTLLETCKREVAALFAHWTQETGERNNASGEFWTQALYHVEEMTCAGGNQNCFHYSSTNWSNTAWPSQAGKQYYGRGPIQLTWNYNYGQFSNIFATSAYDSKMELLQNPERVGTDGYTSMAAGLWFWMTPQDPKPSMHDVMTGFFIPNATDLASGITQSFATTTNIINGGLECGRGFGDYRVASRATYFTEWLGFFGLPSETDLDCGNQPNQFPAGGSSDVKMYFQGNGNRCDLVSWMTQYSIVARDDYKRCVCDSMGGGAASCPQGADDTSNTDAGDNTNDGTNDGADDGADDGTNDGTNDTSVWTTWATLQQIRDTPHYSSTSYSRTLYQVDRELEFIETKIQQLYTVAMDNGIL